MLSAFLCKPIKIVYSEASNSACGSFIQFEDKILHQNWSDFDSSQSSTFYALDELWCPHTCDRFASHYNATLQKFNTRYYQPSSAGVHALVQDYIGRITTTGCVRHSEQFCPVFNKLPDMSPQSNRKTST